MTRRPPKFTPFPYTTLFRSVKRLLKSGVHLANGLVRVTAAKDIPPGHKISLAEIPSDAPVRKYGQVIGFARGAIAPGDHVHTRSEEHTSELQSQSNLVCRLL